MLNLGITAFSMLLYVRCGGQYCGNIIIPYFGASDSTDVSRAFVKRLLPTELTILQL